MDAEETTLVPDLVAQTANAMGMSFSETADALAKAMASQPKAADLFANMRAAVAAGPGPANLPQWQPMGGVNPAAGANLLGGQFGGFTPWPGYGPSAAPWSGSQQYTVTTTGATANPQPDADPVEEPASTATAQALAHEVVELRDLLAQAVLKLGDDPLAETIRARLDAPGTVERPLHVLERWYELSDGPRDVVLAFLQQHDELVPVLREAAVSLSNSQRLDNPVLFLRYVDRFRSGRVYVRAHLRLRIDAWQPDVAERVAAWRAEVWEGCGLRRRARGLIAIEEGSNA